jgi:ribulose-5-phosphate 4-epimerase/fuculose-1-phosphate aldolase
MKEKVSTACRIVYRMGLASYMEHVSARIPGEELLITNPFMSLKRTRPQDLLLVDFAGNLVEGSKSPRGWTLLHIEIFKARKDCNAIVHTHQMMGLLFGMTTRKIMPLLHVAAPTASKEVATFPSPDVIHDSEHAQEIVACIGNRDICHIQGHGIEFLGKSIEEATIAAIHFEQQAMFNYLATSIGFPRPVPEESVKKIIQFQEKDLLPRHWQYYSDLVKQEDAKQEEILTLLKQIKAKLDQLG